jgi:ATP-dependent Lon protease
MTENLPVLILTKHVLLPYQELKLDFHEESAKNVLNLAYEDYNKKVLVIYSSSETYNSDTLPKVGVIAKISKKLLLSNGNLRVILSGLNRVKVKSFNEKDKFIESTIKKLYISNPVTLEEEANIKKLKELAKQYMDETPGASNSIYNLIEAEDDLDKGITIGDIQKVLFGVIGSIVAIGQLAPNIQVIRTASLASSDYFTLLERKPQIYVSEKNIMPERDSIKGSIQFKNIKFIYPSDKSQKPVLN